MKTPRYLFAAAILMAGTAWCRAQSLEEQFRAFQREAEQQYSAFCDSANQRYADFMRQAWEIYHSEPSLPIPDEILTPPVVYDDRQQEQQEQEIDAEPLVPPAPEPAPEPVLPIEVHPSPAPARTCRFPYFGTSCQVRIPAENVAFNTGSETDGFAAGWETLSAHYTAALSDCLRLRETLQLCDWGYLQLLQCFSSACYPKNSNEQVLLCAWLFAQSGYTMRLAYDDQNNLQLLYATRHTIYNTPYYVIGGIKYFPLEKQERNQLSICPATMEQSTPLSLRIDQTPALTANKVTRNWSLSAQTFAVSLNKGLIDFLDTYPSNEIHDNFVTRWALYANTPISSSVRQSLYPLLRDQLKGRTTKESVAYLLNWVQKVFEYAYDDDVWGHDRAFFAEETLYYPYADCEDRSILFSRLVRDLLGLQVLLVYYPGHLATAVAFPEAVHGDYILLDGKRFTICDPTYIGAPVGRTMPDMDNQTAKVIVLE